MKKDCPKKIEIHCLNVPAIAALRYINGNANGLSRQAWSDEDSLQKEGRMSGSSHSPSGDIVTSRLDDDCEPRR